MGFLLGLGAHVFLYESYIVFIISHCSSFGIFLFILLGSQIR